MCALDCVCVCVCIVIVLSLSFAASACGWHRAYAWYLAQFLSLSLYIYTVSHVISQRKNKLTFCQADFLWPFPVPWILWPGKQLHTASICFVCESLSLFLHLAVLVTSRVGSALLPFGQSLGCLHFLRHFIWKQLHIWHFTEQKKEEGGGWCWPQCRHSIIKQAQGAADAGAGERKRHTKWQSVIGVSWAYT